jgi:t-SNARE complex subunit (syntaxin)
MKGHSGSQIFTLVDLKNYIDQQVIKQNHQLEVIHKKLMETTPST